MSVHALRACARVHEHMRTSLEAQGLPCGHAPSWSSVPRGEGCARSSRWRRACGAPLSPAGRAVNCGGPSTRSGERLGEPGCAEVHRAGSLVRAGCARRQHGGGVVRLGVEGVGAPAWPVPGAHATSHRRQGVFTGSRGPMRMPNAVVLPSEGRWAS